MKPPKILSFGGVAGSALMLLAVCFGCPTAQADTITVTPASPTSSDAVTIRVDGVSGVSPSFVITSSTSIGATTLRLFACTNYAGFATGSSYFVLYPLAGLPAGNYTVEYFHAYCASDGTVLVPYQQTVAQALAVSGSAAATAIPTLTGSALMLLGAIMVAMLPLTRKRGN
jgi:hypothetical protein